MCYYRKSGTSSSLEPTYTYVQAEIDPNSQIVLFLFLTTSHELSLSSTCNCNPYNRHIAFLSRGDHTHGGRGNTLVGVVIQIYREHILQPYGRKSTGSLLLCKYFKLYRLQTTFPIHALYRCFPFVSYMLLSSFSDLISNDPPCLKVFPRLTPAVSLRISVVFSLRASLKLG